MRFAAVLLFLSLSGCAALPVAAWTAIAGAAAGTSITAYHYCRIDGGCKALPLPP